jgi:hypothetical protein
MDDSKSKSKPRILIQLDPDEHASAFDAVVAVDSGVEQLLQYSGVESTAVRGLVHGAIFTRGPQDLRNTAVFVGGSNVAQSELLLREVRASSVGPMRVSVMFDANGANTTAAAAVLAAANHLSLSGTEALVLAATGPVGQRVVRLLAREGAFVRAASRDAGRAAEVCRAVQGLVANARLTPLGIANREQLRAALQGTQIVVAAGAAGIQLLPLSERKSAASLRVAIDLNAVPPTGIEAVEVMDQGTQRDGVCCYGAIGVGAAKMKIHKAALRKLFESNDQVLDAEQVFAIGRELAIPSP